MLRCSGEREQPNDRSADDRETDEFAGQDDVTGELNLGATQPDLGVFADLGEANLLRRSVAVARRAFQLSGVVRERQDQRATRRGFERAQPSRSMHHSIFVPRCRCDCGG